MKIIQHQKYDTNIELSFIKSTEQKNTILY